METGWFSCDIDRATLSALTRRSDAAGLLQLGLWLAGLFGSGWLAYRAIGTPWFMSAFIVYGIFFSFAESLAHECSHGTPFQTRRLNEAVYLLVGLMMFKERTYHRWAHNRHHAYTLFPGQDPEIQLPRPLRLATIIAELFGVRSLFILSKALIRHALGDISEADKQWIPERRRPRLISGARFYLAVYASILLASLLMQSWLLLVFFLLPRLLGFWLKAIVTFPQHAGLEQGIKDHRRNSRTVYMNPLLRFLYWNMNYHLEHHLYPTVPFHALARLHEAVKDQLPRPYAGLFDVYREMITTFIRQRRDPDYHVTPVLPLR